MENEWIYRKLNTRDQALLRDFLYIALWDAPEEERRPRSVLDHPKIKRLVEDWGRPEDFGLMAIDPQTHNEMGAIWTRLDGYDELDDFGCDFPCLGIAVLEEHQGKGVGKFLMASFIEALKGRVTGIRLGVNPRNVRAIRLYEQFGFRQYAIGAGNYPQMKLDLVQNVGQKRFP